MPTLQQKEQHLKKKRKQDKLLLEGRITLNTNMSYLRRNGQLFTSRSVTWLKDQNIVIAVISSVEELHFKCQEDSSMDNIHNFNMGLYINYTESGLLRSVLFMNLRLFRSPSSLRFPRILMRSFLFSYTETNLNLPATGVTFKWKLRLKRVKTSRWFSSLAPF